MIVGCNTYGASPPLQQIIAITSGSQGGTGHETRWADRVGRRAGRSHKQNEEAGQNNIRINYPYYSSAIKSLLWNIDRAKTLEDFYF